jgi:hypothetical protein
MRVNIRVPVLHAPVYYGLKPDDKHEHITPLTKDDLESARDAEFLRSRPMELTRFPNLLPWYLRAIDLCKNKHICKLPAILAV